MSDLSTILTSKEAVKLISSRIAAEVTLKSVVTTVNSLDVNNLDPRTFRRLENKYESKFLTWEKTNEAIIALVIKHDPVLATHKDFLAEMERVRIL